MHPVSQKFLQSINIDDIDHKTQKISEELVKESKIIFCMDDKIVTEVQKRFPDHAAKARLILQSNIADPLNFEDKTYMKLMQDMKLQLEEVALKLKTIF